MIDLDIDLVLKWREEREKFEAGLKMLAAKFSVENMLPGVSEPDGDWPSMAGPKIEDIFELIQGDILLILEGWDLRAAMVGYTEEQ